MWFYLGILHLKDVNERANRVVPRAVWSRFTLFAQTCLSEYLRSLHYLFFLSQLEKQKEKLSGTQLWLSLPARFKFYRGCADKFQKHGVSAVKIVEYFEVTVINHYYFWVRNTHLVPSYNHIWAATWQNQQSECAPSEDSDQPGRIRPGWSESSLSAWRKLGSLATH